MEAKFFQQGNYIYECKTSPTNMEGYFDISYLQQSVNKLRKRWERGNIPSGYRYVFPVNEINDKAISIINNLQDDYPSIDIKYYDCNQVNKLIISLEKLGDLKSLVDYLKQVRGK
ncbi:hypothetical protein I8748_32355 [Nostoc sp. CENA67]|uniref:Uncharacterized protein n=1 Tax=Amazonocrinis nigriterrae CENA67 TaxID=2794033 RepID=A0A8J7HVJ5_9NOST|nr:hypothetical protein [Amazonocrinis nigriterrae]MBH8566788.1 hypothetical protein [Amazonocrinis nigriterrae CENA67]